ncbi:hypothetical protein IFM89_028468, partial [Coptis chinensis]
AVISNSFYINACPLTPLIYQCKPPQAGKLIQYLLEILKPHDSPSVNVPRWTPSPSPTRSPPRVKNDDLELNSFNSQAAHNIPSQNQTLFPFSSFTSPPLPHYRTQTQPERILDAPSFQIGNKINSPIGSETVSLMNTRQANYIQYDAGGLRSQSDGVLLTWEDLCVTVSAGKNGSRSILEGLTGYAQPGEVLAIMGPSGCGKSTLLDALAGRLDSKTRQSGQILVNGHRQGLTFGTSVKKLLLSSFLSSVALTFMQQTSEASFLDEPTSGLDSAASYHVMKRIVDLAKQDGRTGGDYWRRAAKQASLPDLWFLREGPL